MIIHFPYPYNDCTPHHKTQSLWLQCLEIIVQIVPSNSDHWLAIYQKHATQEVAESCSQTQNEPLISFISENFCWRWNASFKGGYLSFKSGQTKVFHNILLTPQIHNYLNLAIFYLESLSQQQAPCHWKQTTTWLKKGNLSQCASHQVTIHFSHDSRIISGYAPSSFISFTYWLKQALP